MGSEMCIRDRSNLGSNNYSNNNHIAYCWHSVPGYSAFGLYAGNGDNDNDDDPDPPYLYWFYSSNGLDKKHQSNQ